MKQKLLKIDAILYYVKDIERSSKFYEEVLGLKKVWKDTDRKMIGFIFPQSDSEIVLHTDKTMPNPDFSFLVESVKEFCEEYKSLGYKVIKEPFEVRTGYYAILSDPDDNVIEIIDLTAFGNKPRYD